MLILLMVFFCFAIVFSIKPGIQYTSERNEFLTENIWIFCQFFSMYENNDSPYSLCQNFISLSGVYQARPYIQLCSFQILLDSSNEFTIINRLRYNFQRWFEFREIRWPEMDLNVQERRNLSSIFHS